MYRTYRFVLHKQICLCVKPVCMVNKLTAWFFRWVKDLTSPTAMDVLSLLLVFRSHPSWIPRSYSRWNFSMKRARKEARQETSLMLCHFHKSYFSFCSWKPSLGMAVCVFDVFDLDLWPWD